jgi:glycosyltransferase involved in cell wall biosynthesis
MSEPHTQSGGEGAAESATRVCIAAPYKPALTETFIRGHVERMPARVALVYGYPLTQDERPVLSTAQRVYHKALRTLSRTGVEREMTEAYMTVLRRERTDVVLAEYGDTGTQVTEACRRLRVPLVVHFHGYDASVREVLEEHRESYPRMFREAAAVIAVSQAMRRKLASLGATPEKLHYNPYGINLESFGGADPSNAPPVFVAVGRFVEKKAPQLTIKAFAGVRRDVPEARLRMVGDGPLLEECRALVGELGLNDAVEFLGAQAHERVQAEMRGARCFVQHSVEAPNGDCEGTPVGVLEAGASGLAVVATRHAGIPDAVVEGETGFLIEERDVSGMAAHMTTLARDPALAGLLGAKARRHIAENFSMERSDRKLWSIIESCVARRAA